MAAVSNDSNPLVTLESVDDTIDNLIEDFYHDAEDEITTDEEDEADLFDLYAQQYLSRSTTPLSDPVFERKNDLGEKGWSDRDCDSRGEPLLDDMEDELGQKNSRFNSATLRAALTEYQSVKTNRTEEVGDDTFGRESSAFELE